MLAARAPVGDAELREAPAQVVVHLRIHEPTRALPERLGLRCALQRPDHGCVETREAAVALLPPGIREGPAVEHEPSPVLPAVVRVAPPVAEARELDLEARLHPGSGPPPAVDDPPEDAIELGDPDGRGLLDNLSEDPGGRRDALHEAGPPLEYPPVAVGAHRLHHPDQSEPPETFDPGVPVDGPFGLERIQIGVQQPLPCVPRDPRRPAEQEGGHVVLERPPASPLKVDEPRIAPQEHDVPGLEVPVHEVGGLLLEGECGEAPEVLLERALAEGDLREPEEVVLEVVQVPEDRALVEVRAGVGDAVVHGASPLDLKAGQAGESTGEVGLDPVRKRLSRTPPGLFERLMERRVAQVFGEPYPGAFIRRVDLGDGEPGGAQGAGEGEEGPVLQGFRAPRADRGLAVRAREAKV